MKPESRIPTDPNQTEKGKWQRPAQNQIAVDEECANAPDGEAHQEVPENEGETLPGIREQVGDTGEPERRDIAVHEEHLCKERKDKK